MCDSGVADVIQPCIQMAYNFEKKQWDSEAAPASAIKVVPKENKKVRCFDTPLDFLHSDDGCGLVRVQDADHTWRTLTLIRMQRLKTQAWPSAAYSSKSQNSFRYKTPAEAEEAKTASEVEKETTLYDLDWSQDITQANRPPHPSHLIFITGLMQKDEQEEFASWWKCASEKSTTATTETVTEPVTIQSAVSAGKVFITDKLYLHTETGTPRSAPPGFSSQSRLTDDVLVKRLQGRCFDGDGVIKEKDSVLNQLFLTSKWGIASAPWRHLFLTAPDTSLPQDIIPKTRPETTPESFNWSIKGHSDVNSTIGTKYHMDGSWRTLLSYLPHPELSNKVKQEEETAEEQEYGGNTRFPYFSASLKPLPEFSLWFQNKIFPSGEPDLHLHHCGEPIKRPKLFMQFQTSS